MPAIGFAAEDLALAQAIECSIPFGASFESIATALELVLARQLLAANETRSPIGNEFAVQMVTRHMRGFLEFGDVLLVPIAQMVPANG